MPTTRALLLRSRHFHTLLLFLIMLLVAMLLSRAGWPFQSASTSGAAPSTMGGASDVQGSGPGASAP
jgi:hypothetical protein